MDDYLDLRGYWGVSRFRRDAITMVSAPFTSAADLGKYLDMDYSTQVGYRTRYRSLGIAGAAGFEVYHTPDNDAALAAAGLLPSDGSTWTKPRD